jgi:ABC-type sugar transport system ATPase subunit
VPDQRTYAAAGVSKSFSGVTVLRNVDFELRSGEVHALVGENGSGKSTLIKILGGVHRPSAGHLEVDGEPLAVATPADAARAGLAVVHQDYQLFPALSVAANVAVGRSMPRRRLLRTLDRRELRRRAARALETVGLLVDPDRLLGTLRLAEWKLVEIARALVAQAAFVVLDEPTALLDRHDSARILELIERLRGEGVGVAFVSHRLDEALRVADCITVLRDGRRIDTLPAAGVRHEQLVELIVGRAAAAEDVVADRTPGDVALELSRVRALSHARPFDLELRRGEILGLTGLIGSGALEVAQMLAGRRPVAGTVRVEGREVAISSPAHAIRAGIGYIPEERATHGLVSELSVETNVSLASLKDVTPLGVLRRGRLQARAQRFAEQLSIRAPSLHAPVRTLSGGNQQKVQIAKWLAARRSILVIESPTHGVDVGAKLEIHRLLADFAASGGAVVIASTDIPEALSIADRVAVFSRGELVQVVDAAEASHGQLLLSGTRAPELDAIEALIEK